MATPTGEEITLTIPAETFVRRHACGVDFGGSLIKLAYTEPCGDPDKLQIHCLSYRTQDLRDAMTDFKTRAGPALATGEPIKTCGVGGSQHVATMKDILGVDLVNMLEFDRFLDAFKFLSETLPEEEFLHPESDKLKVVREEHLGDAKHYIEAFSAISGHPWRLSKEECVDEADDMDNEMVRYYKHYAQFVSKERDRKAAHVKFNSANTEKVDSEGPQGSRVTKQSYVTYPFLLYMCGSAGCPMMVTSDGKLNVLDIRPMGGRSFTAMGKLLCGAKSYEEVLSLAESGSESNVNTYPKDVIGLDDGYTGLPRHMLFYAMGKASTEDPASFRPEDLAAATMTSLAEAVAEHAQLWALLLCLKNIYFVGSMVNSRLARDEIAKFSVTRSMANSLGTTTKPHFVKPCGYLGAIGCLLATLRTELPSGDQQ